MVAERSAFGGSCAHRRTHLEFQRFKQEKDDTGSFNADTSGIRSNAGDTRLIAWSLAATRLNHAPGQDTIAEESQAEHNGRRGAVSATARGDQLRKDAESPSGKLVSRYMDDDMLRPERQRGKATSRCSTT